MSDPEKRVSAEVSESEISGSRDFQADPALASGRASGNQLGGPRIAARAQACYVHADLQVKEQALARTAP